MDTILKGQDILVIRDISAQDDSTIDDQIQRLINQGEYTLIVLISSANSDKACAAIVEKLTRSNVANHTHVILLASEQWNHMLAQARDCHEIFYLKECRLSPPPTHTPPPPHTRCNTRSFEDQPHVQQKINRVVRLLGRAKDYGIMPCALLTGETGTGKTYTAEQIAEQLKAEGGRRGKFVSVNCGSLPQEHIDSFLFGVSGRKFTGVSEGKGAIEEADDGVLFLDEIGNLPLEAQSHLLTFLDKGKYRYYGDQATERQADCVIIFGTNANLKEEIIAGKFRRDLYARINSLEIWLPTVATRISDATTGDLFLSAVIESMCRQYKGMKLTDAADRRFRQFAKAFPWHNNFRDIKHFFENLVLEMLWDPSEKVASDNVVSARQMDNTIKSFVQSLAQSDSADVTSDEQPTCETTRAQTPLPIETDNLAEYEIRTLGFLSAICRDSPNKAAAGRRFFKGKKLANPSDAITKFLKGYGLRWDYDEPNHLSRF